MREIISTVFSVFLLTSGCVTTPPYMYEVINTENFDPVGKHCYENSFLTDYNKNAYFLNTHTCQYVPGEVKSKLMESLFLTYGGHSSFKSFIRLKGHVYACISAKHAEKRCRLLDGQAVEARQKEQAKQEKEIFYRSQSNINDECMSSNVTRLYLIWGQTCSLKSSHMDKEAFRQGYFEYARDNKVNLDKKFEDAYQSFIEHLGG